MSLADDAVRTLSLLDDEVEDAVRPATRPSWPTRCMPCSSRCGPPVRPSRTISLDSDLILPGADATLDEVRELLSGSEEGWSRIRAT